MLKLIVMGGKKQGAEIPLSEGETTIGRTEENAIRLKSKQISRKHAVIYVMGTDCKIKDLQSTSGTYVDGKRIESVDLKFGAMIQMGDYAFRLEGPSVNRGKRGEVRSSVKVGSPRDSAQKADLPGDPQQDPADTLGQKFFRYPWKFQVIISLLLVVLFGLAGLFFFFHQVQSDFHGYAEERSRLLARNLALKNGEYLKRGQELLLNIDEVTREIGVKGAWIQDTKFRVLVPKGLRGNIDERPVARVVLERRKMVVENLSNGWLEIGVPIEVWDSEKASFENFGVATLVFSPQEVVRNASNLRIRIFLVLALLLGGGVMAFALINRGTSSPLIRLQEDTELMIQGINPEVRSSASWAELQELASSINRAYARGAGAGLSALEPTPDAGLGTAEPMVNLSSPADVAVESSSPPVELGGYLVDITEPAVVVDDSSTLLDINEAGAEVLECSALDVKGKHLLEVVKDPELAGALLDVLNQLSEGPEDSTEVSVTWKGEERTISGSAVRSGNELASATILIK